MALVPFVPSSNDLQKLVVDLQEVQTIPLLTDLPTTINARLTSSSTWGAPHLHALNVGVLLDLENCRIIPSKYIPKDGDEDFSLLKSEIRQITIDGLKDFDRSDFRLNRFVEFFNYLSICVATGTSEETILKREGRHEVGHERRLSGASSISTSSNEDKAENASELACQYFIAGILELFDSLRFLTPEGKRGDKLAVQPHRQILSWTMAGSRKCSAVNDGGLYVVARGSTSKSQRHSRVPVISIEAKRRHAGGIKRPSAEPQPYVPELIAQEFGEMLSQASEQRKLGYEKSTFDQEAFVASMHGTLFRLSCAYFSDEYLTCVKQMTSVPNATRIYFRRSRAFEMKDPSDRVEASRLLFGALKYLRSGEARIATLQAVL